MIVAPPFRTFLLRSVLWCAVMLVATPFWLHADEWKVSFADSTALHTPPWLGSMDNFTLTGDGLALCIPNPKSSYNRAFLAVVLTETPALSWGGTLSFGFTPSVQNRIVILLYPYKSYRSKDGNQQKDWVALEVGATNPPTLVTLVAEEMPEGYYRITHQTALIDNVQTFPYTAASNKLSWRVNRDAAGKWQLFINTYNALNNQFRLVGEAQLPESAYDGGEKKFATALSFTCSKKNADGSIVIKELSFSNEAIIPEEKSIENSIIADFSVDEKAITLLCTDEPDVSKALFLLTPPGKELQPKVTEKKILLPLDAPLAEGQYTLDVSGICFLNGSISPAESFVFDIGRGDTPGKRPNPVTLRLSEVMARPIASSAEYIELYNEGDEPVDLNQFGFALRNEGRLGKLIPIKTANRYLPAKAYRAVTPWAEALMLTHGASADELAETSTFPSLPNTSGQIALIRRADSLILEEMTYAAAQITRDGKKEGIALERASFEVSSLLPDNWHAASASSGYATPGKPNSTGDAPNAPEEGKTGEKGKGKHLSPRTVAQKMLDALKDNSCELKMFIYSVRGMRIAVWQHERCALWAEKTVREGLSADPLPTIFGYAVVSVHIKRSDTPKAEQYNFVYMH